MDNIEFDLLVFYLTKSAASSSEKESYARGLETMNLQLDQHDQLILAWCIKHPKWMRYVDCGLSLKKEKKNLKKRFLLAAAIVECQPRNAHSFLNDKRTSNAYLKMLFWAVKACWIMSVSKLLFALKRW
jgi:hypothetical protein